VSVPVWGVAGGASSGRVIVLPDGHFKRVSMTVDLARKHEFPLKPLYPDLTLHRGASRARLAAVLQQAIV
jgi:hypothetical protein